jgi:Flp pilus assembly protein TadG
VKESDMQTATPGSPTSDAQDGVAAVEFAMIVMVFLMIVFAIIAYGVYFATHQAVSHAASEAALIAADVGDGNPDEAGARALVESQLEFLGDAFDAGSTDNMTVTRAGCDDCVTVEITFPWRGAGEIVKVPFVRTPERIRATAVVRTW